MSDGSHGHLLERAPRLPVRPRPLDADAPRGHLRRRDLLRSLAELGVALAGTPMAGAALAGTPLAGTALAGTPLAGTPLAGAALAGTPLAGAALAGTATAQAGTGSGDDLAGARPRSLRPRLVLLGTKGGPRPGTRRFGSSQALVLGDEIHVVDCGDGVATRLRQAGLPLRNVRHVYLTHMHSDHTADYGNLLYFAWYSGSKGPIDVWGPPQIISLTEAALAYHAYDVEVRMEDEGRKTMRDLVRPRPLTTGGELLRTPRVRVRAAIVRHPPFVHAFAYRFDTRAGSVVISGDTAPSDALVELARGADILVHEALYKPALDRYLDRLESLNARFRRHLDRSHTTAVQAGAIAARAGVKKLVLSHLVPGNDVSVSARMWIDAARTHYDGPIVVGRDLLEIPLPGGGASEPRD